MLDVSYESIVVDDPDYPTSEEIVMHVRIIDARGDEDWHRLTPNQQSTACGLSFHVTSVNFRRQVLAGPLCRHCFTLFERLAGAENDKKPFETNGEKK